MPDPGWASSVRRGPIPPSAPLPLTRDPREAQTLPGALAPSHALHKPLAYTEP